MYSVLFITMKIRTFTRCILKMLVPLSKQENHTVIKSKNFEILSKFCLFFYFVASNSATQNNIFNRPLLSHFHHIQITSSHTYKKCPLCLQFLNGVQYIP